MKKYLLILLLFSQNSFAADEVSQSTILDLLGDYVFEDSSSISSSSRLALDLSFDDNYSAKNSRDEYRDTNFKARLNNNLKFGNGISLNSNIRIGRLDNVDQRRRRVNSTRGGNRSFENVGAIIREFNISKSGEKYSLVAGKFNLNFGSAWQWNRGLWIHDLANSNYRQLEKLGFVGIYRLGDAKKTGQYNFSFSAFTNDRKNFDNSLLVNRDSDKKSSAKAGDSRSLKSYSAILDINFDFSEREKLAYQFSYLNLAVNENMSAIAAGKLDSQKDFALNIDYQYPLGDKILLNSFVEYVEVKNLNGDSDFGERYLTTNLITKFDNGFSFLLGNSRRQNLQLGGNGFDQNLTEASIGYEFTKNSFFDRLTIQSGYKHFRNDQRTFVDKQNSVGLLIRYYKNF